eukprot:178619_1
MDQTQALDLYESSDEEESYDGIQDAIAHLYELDAAGATVQTHILYKGSTTVGRDPKLNKIRFDKASVSATHATIDLEDDEFWVEDLNSRNGTFIGARRLRKRRAYPAQHKDEVTFGDVKCRLEILYPHWTTIWIGKQIMSRCNSH